jgi:hypothetical protein
LGFPPGHPGALPLLHLLFGGGRVRHLRPARGRHYREAQATAEGACYDEESLLRLLRLARIGCDRIFTAQGEAVAK